VQTIQLNETKFTGPEKWNDLTTQNLIDLAKTIGYNGDQVFVNYVLVSLLFNIPKKWLKLLQRSQLEQMTATLDFLFETNELSKWLISTIGKRFQKCYGPKDRLADVTTWEFVQIEAYYERYVQYQDEKYLNAFIAALYRPRRLFSKKRVDFNEETINKRVSMVEKLPPYIKTAIYTNYTGCRNLIVRLHPNLFYRTSNDEGITPKASNQIIEWNSHVLGISGGPLGEYEAVKKQKIWITLKHMDDMAAAQRRKS
jgi:hypothetical protein